MSPVNDRGAISTNELALLSSSAKLLFQNGQTTQSTTTTVTRLATALGHRALLFPRWDEICIRIDGPDGGQLEIVDAAAAGVDMNKVVATMKVIDDVCDGRINVTAARSSLDAIARYPPVGVARFALFAGAGAAALGVIFGTVHWRALILIAFSAGLGACLRHWLAGPTPPQWGDGSRPRTSALGRCTHRLREPHDLDDLSWTARRAVLRGSDTARLRWNYIYRLTGDANR